MASEQSRGHMQNEAFFVSKIGVRDRVRLLRSNTSIFAAILRAELHFDRIFAFCTNPVLVQRMGLATRVCSWPEFQNSSFDLHQ